MVMPADYFKSEFAKPDENLINTEHKHMEALQLAQKIVPNIDIVTPVDSSEMAYTLTIQLAQKHTKRNKILIIDTPLVIKNDQALEIDKNTDFILADDTAQLCEAIACSEERIAAIVVKHVQFSPYYYKKVRELASAEGAIMIFDLLNMPSINEINHFKISKNSLPDIICINLTLKIPSIWVGGRADLMSIVI